MRALFVAIFPLLLQIVWARSAFNVTQALLNNGIQANQISSLSTAHKKFKANICGIACTTLRSWYKEDQTEIHEEPAYNASIDYFWSIQQRELTPSCVFKPENAIEVSSLVLLSRLTTCPFAVRSGGHAAFAGASSIDGGITVILERMKQITLSKDKSIASIEPGNLWYDVYNRLAQDSLAVVGGRVSDIGIGGLTTGGGISFFSNQYGWACDNVESYEVVTASGAIVTASATSAPDLYWALRGGGNNFGIVSKFNLRTFAQGGMWGGSRVFLNNNFPSAMDAFVNLGVNAAQDPKAAQYLAVALDVSSGTQIGVSVLTYADPIVNAPIFEEYLKIPAISDTTKLNSLAGITQELNVSNPKGYRESYWTASAKLDRALVELVVNVSFDEFSKIQDVPGVVPANTLQVITVPQLEQMQQNGGNALGLLPADGPIFLINLSTRWDRAEDDARVIQANANIVKRMQEESKRTGLHNDYLYMNYASQYQDVIGSYGKSAKRLRQIAKKYDPEGVFQKLQPGYFKLDGAPERGELWA